MYNKSLRSFVRYGCVLEITLPLANYSFEVECHWFICDYSLEYLERYFQYGPAFFPFKFIRVRPCFYLLGYVDPYNYNGECRKFTCHNFNDICRILMRNILVALSIDASNLHLNISKL